jgi:hypothetical protein
MGAEAAETFAQVGAQAHEQAAVTSKPDPLAAFRQAFEPDTQPELEKPEKDCE